MKEYELILGILIASRIHRIPINRKARHHIRPFLLAVYAE